MDKVKLQSLTKYAQDLKNKLESPIPPKHASHPDTYKQFLKHELSAVTAKLEKAKLDAAGK